MSQVTSPPPRTGYAFFDAVLDQPGAVIAMAHRGGALHPEIPGVENTLHAFQHAVALGYGYLETDVHVSSDGVLLAFHDPLLDRVTDRTGPLATLRAEEIAEARVGGAHAVPTMASLLEELPTIRFNIDLKTPAAVPALVELLDHTGAHDRVCVGSFSASTMAAFRRASAGRVATSAVPHEVAAFVLLPFGRAVRSLTRHRIAALQIPRRRSGITLLTPRLIRTAHAAGAHVHIWTVDEPTEMAELLDLGVDGLITDRTDVLKDVLTRRGQWLTPRRNPA